jgi:hypothetical protein
MLNFCPDLQSVQPNLRKTHGEFIFLIDRSGSMSGTNIHRVKVPAEEPLPMGRGSSVNLFQETTFQKINLSRDTQTQFAPKIKPSSDGSRGRTVDHLQGRKLSVAILGVPQTFVACLLSLSTSLGPEWKGVQRREGGD